MEVHAGIDPLPRRPDLHRSLGDSRHADRREPSARVGVVHSSDLVAIVCRHVGLHRPVVVEVRQRGHIHALSRVATPSGTYILAGGTNNEHGAASLAVLEEQGPSASSPSGATSSLTCDACPSRGPAKYLLFPRSELNIASDWPRNFVYLFTPNEAGAVDVSVQEHSPPPLRAVYELSADLTPKSVAMSDAYWEAHRRLSAEGKLNHTPEECPERKRGMSVRSWDPQSGWKEFLVPHAPVARCGRTPSTEQQQIGGTWRSRDKR